MLLQVTTGQENFESASAKSFVFVVPSRSFPLPEERHLWVVARDGSHGVSSLPGGQKVDAAPGLRSEFGSWWRRTYDVPEGMILKVFGRRTSQGNPVASANRYVQMRRDAPVLRLSTRLTGDRRAALTSATVEGNFYVVSLEEAARFGVETRPNFRGFFHDSAVEAVFTVEELARGAPRPSREETVVVNTSGDEVSFVNHRPRRRALRLD